MCFKMPKPPKPPRPPSESPARKADLRERADLVRGALASGRRSTNPTGGRGLIADAPVLRKTLLGE